MGDDWGRRKSVCIVRVILVARGARQVPVRGRTLVLTMILLRLRAVSGSSSLMLSHRSVFFNRAKILPSTSYHLKRGKGSKSIIPTKALDH